MPNVAPFLIDRLKRLGLRHVFGVPGDYILPTYKRLQDAKDISLVNCTDEAHAGFAADGYARINGIGCVCVTFGVGTSKIINSVGCAYAERSPVIVLAGSPGMKERREGVLLHHTVGTFENQEETFRKYCCATTVLSNPNRAAYEIDRVLEALLYYRQPVYIELPRDVAERPIEYDVYDLGTPVSPKSDTENLKDAVSEVANWISNAKNPVIMAGVELARFGLGAELVQFAERANIPIVTEILSKSVVGEQHPLFCGVYGGSMSEQPVRDLVEKSDCLLLLGAIVTDMTLSFMPPKFHKRDTVHATVGELKVRNHNYNNVVFSDFCQGLFKAEISRTGFQPWTKKESIQFVPEATKKLTTTRFFEKVESILDRDKSITADVGDSLFGAMDLPVHQSNAFVANAFYTSMGTAIPFALGVGLAKEASRPLVLVGDGAFQMSLSEISTIIQWNLNPIIFVLNNGGYTTERLLMEGKFNDIRNWEYHKVVDLFGGGKGWKVETEEELEVAVAEALENKSVSVINVVVGAGDRTPALQRMASELAKRVN